MRTQAIIIKKQSTNEYDQFVTCYTQELGKLTAIAKSVLKPHSVQAMQLNLMNLVEFELVSGRGIPIITGTHTVRAHYVIKDNLSNLGIAYFFLEAIDRIIFDYERDDQLWNLLTELFTDLNMPLELGAIMPLLRRKQKELLTILGYAPEASLTVNRFNGHAQEDSVFEQLAQSHFASLSFLYRVLSSANLPAGRQV
ncbi:MAG TPA: DNA repair protein RecO [Candidatus Paceibacterota bacterium]|nr:DNA repair protein RecO [Candidatus Paceibacterota bacterium]